MSTVFAVYSESRQGTAANPTKQEMREDKVWWTKDFISSVVILVAKIEGILHEKKSS